MKSIWRDIIGASLGLVVATFLVGTPVSGAEAKKEKAKPYPLKTCIVSDEKLDGDSGMKPHTFVYKGQEIKLCCKGCLKDFNKDPQKYLKKLDEQAKKTK